MRAPHLHGRKTEPTIPVGGKGGDTGGGGAASARWRDRDYDTGGGVRVGDTGGGGRSAPHIRGGRIWPTIPVGG